MKFFCLFIFALNRYKKPYRRETIISRIFITQNFVSDWVWVELRTARAKLVPKISVSVDLYHPLYLCHLEFQFIYPSFFNDQRRVSFCWRQPLPDIFVALISICTGKSRVSSASVKLFRHFVFHRSWLTFLFKLILYVVLVDWCRIWIGQTVYQYVF